MNTARKPINFPATGSSRWMNTVKQLQKCGALKRLNYRERGRAAFELLDSLGSEVRSLFVMGSNVAVASSHSSRIEQRLKSLELLVVCDVFHNETSEHAHVFLPVFQWAEEEGTMTNLEGRVIRRRAVARALGPLSDSEILRELADRLGCGDKFAYRDTEAIFNELRRATAGSIADYSGISYAKIATNDGVFWPCKSEEDVGTPRMFTERFHHADGRAKFFAVEHRAAGEEPDEQFPLLFTTGATRSITTPARNAYGRGNSKPRRAAAATRNSPAAGPTACAVVTGSRVTIESRAGRSNSRRKSHRTFARIRCSRRSTGADAMPRTY